MYFKDRREQRQTREIIAGLFAGIENYCDEKTRNALLLTQRILQDTDIEADDNKRKGDISIR